MTEPLLRMTAITKRFPGVVALDGVGLEVAAGEVHGLLGENGAGKSTLLKILSGAQAQDGGSIVFAGETVSFAAPYEAQRRGIVTIYQEFNLIPSLTVGENILIGREPGRAGLVDWRAMHRVAKAALDRIGLAIDPRRLVRDLSVAEQQMVEIARALSMDSRLIVMDEPTTALDVVVQREILQQIDVLRRKLGFSILFITHDLSLMVQFCDRIGVMLKGKLVEVGAAQQIFRAPAHEYTRKLWASFPSVHGARRTALQDAAEAS